MGDKKYYAVKKGRTRGIFGTWEECRASVEGYPGAEYKGFKDIAEAQGYLERAGQAVPRPERLDREEKTGSGSGHSDREEKTGSGSGHTDREEKTGSGSEHTDREGRTGSGYGHPAGGWQTASWPDAAPEERPEPGTLLAYVDGSYDHSLRKYAFGCVFILPDGRVCTEYGNGEKEQALRHRNVSGEMLGAMYAVRTAMVSGFGKVEIRYDYEGIEKWVTGQWRSKTELTGMYAGSMREWGKKIKICFTKVAAHSNVYYNELADKMAKTGLREGQGTPKVRDLEEKWNR